MKSKLNIVILHNPTIFHKPVISKNLKNIVKTLKKYGNVYNYFFKFAYYGHKFTLNDITFNSASKDIYNTYKHLNKFVVIAIEHAVPYGLYFSNKYPQKCSAFIGYPYRYYCKESYERRLWKFKNNKGFDMMVNNKKYNIDEHLINITETKFNKLFDILGDSEKRIIYLVADFYRQKNYNLIPTKFKIPTYLYTRLDLDEESVIKLNYNRKSIAKIKKIFSENDALMNSMIWNFDRVKFDSMLRKKNKTKLTIKYIITGWENYNDIVDNVVLLKYK